MGREQLQGIPWHEEQIMRTCKDGSKYCLYNKNICTCLYSRFYHKKCVGKGECDWFETKGNTTKVLSSKQIIQTEKEKSVMNEQPKPIEKDDKTENFIRLANKRTNKILEDINMLTNLANKNQYIYTDKQVDKIFGAIEEAVQFAKDNFKNKQNIGKFSL